MLDHFVTSFDMLIYWLTGMVDDCCSQVLVSMLLELAPSTQVADLMAEFFHDVNNTHPELQERLDKVMAQWQVSDRRDSGMSVTDGPVAGQ